jgi:hypothetical protein
MPTMNSLVNGVNLKRGANAVRHILPYTQSYTMTTRHSHHASRTSECGLSTSKHMWRYVSSATRNTARHSAVSLCSTYHHRALSRTPLRRGRNSIESIPSGPTCGVGAPACWHSALPSGYAGSSCSIPPPRSHIRVQAPELTRGRAAITRCVFLLPPSPPTIRNLTLEQAEAVCRRIVYPMLRRLSSLSVPCEHARMTWCDTMPQG